MNRYQVRYHTAREELHRACDPTCPVYKLDMESLRDFDFKLVDLRKANESSPSLQPTRTLRQPPIVEMLKPPSMLDLESPTNRNPVQRYLAIWTTTPMEPTNLILMTTVTK
ncbi:hypothetical protein PGTUg99_010243 [Puccinia graminis f. sp. tritici]|uniref:Uncharacterized protein n=1 Tax=Puccinia graminis f. sp. tritici TaxID=56615 RepID=A0A5B0PJ57_PUCGR|nr:hypothetical protein PGTUg99_010243 [Puccinia graminis f. sp. tritici]